MLALESAPLTVNVVPDAIQMPFPSPPIYGKPETDKLSTINSFPLITLSPEISAI